MLPVLADGASFGSLFTGIRRGEGRAARRDVERTVSTRLQGPSGSMGMLERARARTVSGKRIPGLRLPIRPLPCHSWVFRERGAPPRREGRPTLFAVALVSARHG